jgi:hypothetical protein
VSLSPSKVSEAIADRFGRWGRFLTANKATPMIVLGMTPEGKTVLTTCAGITNEQVIALLFDALRSVAAGRIEEPRRGPSSAPPRARPH